MTLNLNQEKNLPKCTIHTRDDQFCSLVQTFVIPVGVLVFENITDAVMFSQPNGRENEESWQKGKERMSKSELVVFSDGDVRRVVHRDTFHIF